MSIAQKILVLTFIFLTSTFVDAQEKYLGVHAGYTSGKLSGDSKAGLGIETAWMNGMHYGIHAELHNHPMYYRIGATIAHQEGDVVQNYGPFTFIEDFKLTTLQVPFIVGVEIIGPLALEGGPYFNYVLNHNYGDGSELEDFQKFGLGYKIGPSFRVATTSINLSFEGFFNPSDQDGVYSIREPFRVSLGFGLLF